MVIFTELAMNVPLAAPETAKDLRSPKPRHVVTDTENGLRPGEDRSSRHGRRLAGAAERLERSEGSGTKIEAIGFWFPVRECRNEGVLFAEE